MASKLFARLRMRRGLKADLPSAGLGSEILHCVDTQEVFIGNGTLADGAPVLGNTQILTVQPPATANLSAPVFVPATILSSPAAIGTSTIIKYSLMQNTIIGTATFPTVVTGTNDLAAVVTSSNIGTVETGTVGFLTSTTVPAVAGTLSFNAGAQTVTVLNTDDITTIASNITAAAIPNVTAAVVLVGASYYIRITDSTAAAIIIDVASTPALLTALGFTAGSFIGAGLAGSLVINGTPVTITNTDTLANIITNIGIAAPANITASAVGQTLKLTETSDAAIVLSGSVLPAVGLAAQTYGMGLVGNVIINSNSVSIISSDALADLITNINTAAISNISASNSANHLRITDSSAPTITLSGTALASLGLTAGIITAGINYAELGISGNLAIETSLTPLVIVTVALINTDTMLTIFSKIKAALISALNTNIVATLSGNSIILTATALLLPTEVLSISSTSTPSILTALGFISGQTTASRLGTLSLISQSDGTSVFLSDVSVSSSQTGVTFSATVVSGIIYLQYVANASSSTMRYKVDFWPV